MNVKTTLYYWMSTYFMSLNRCSLCGRRCPSKIALKSHLKCHDGEGGGFPAKCDICDRVFSRKHLMERHKLHKHINHQTEFKCTECNKVFGHQSMYELILEIWSYKRMYVIFKREEKLPRTIIRLLLYENQSMMIPIKQSCPLIVLWFSKTKMLNCLNFKHQQVCYLLALLFLQPSVCKNHLHVVY